MTKEPIDFEYVTNDLELAAYLQTIGKKLLDVRRQDARRAQFVFLDVQDHEIQAYLNKEDRVSTMDVLSNFKNLKNMIYIRLGDDYKQPNKLKKPERNSLRYKL
jgi:hypothetical protein